MFDYECDGGEFSIDTTGFCKDFSEVKNETISQTPECIHRRSTYPNGFVIEILQYPDKMILRTNRLLLKKDDKTFTIL